jgi:hypothetical protein
MLRRLIVKNQYGLRRNTLCVIALLFISFVFCVMSIVTFFYFDVGIPVAAIVFAAIATFFFVRALWELQQLWSQYLSIHDAIAVDDCPQFYEDVA